MLLLPLTSRARVRCASPGGAAMEVRVAVPFGVPEVDGGTAAALDAAHGPCRRFRARARRSKSIAFEVFEDGFLIVLDGADHVVGAAPEQAAAPSRAGRASHRRCQCGLRGRGCWRARVRPGISVALAVDLHLPEDHATSRVPPPATGSSMRPSSDLLRGSRRRSSAVHGDRRMCPTFPIYHPNSWKSYHFPTAKGTVSPMQPSRHPRWHDFGNRPALGRPLGHFSRHPDTPLLSLSPRRRFPRPTPERVFVADHQSSSGFSGTGPSAPPPQPIGT